MISTIRQAFNLMDRDQWGRWVILVVLALIVSGFEMLGALLVFLLVALATNPSAQINLPIVGDIRSLTGDLDDRSLLLWAAAIIASFFVVRGILQVWTIYYQRVVAEKAGAKVSITLFGGYLRSPYPFHLHRSSAELIRNSHQAGLDLVNRVFIPIITIVAQSLLTLGLLIVLITIAPVASGLVVVSVGGAALLVLFFVQPKLKHLGRAAHLAQRDTLEWLQQSLEGIRDVKLFAAEEYFVLRYGRGRLELAHSRYLSAAIRQMMSTIIETTLIGFILIFLSVSVVVGSGAQRALPILALFAYVGLRLLPSIQRIIGSLNDLRYSTAPLADLHQDLEAVRTLPPIDPDSDPLPFKQILQLEKVSYRYDESNRKALSDVDLIIRPGEEIGICGPTGGGKTTLIDIITGLLTPTEGRVTVDAVDIAGCVGKWQQNLGVVSQMIFLIDDTLRGNIALGLTSDEIDEAAMTKAVNLAQLTEFVSSLPDGLNTMVGERGVRISGGQRQRIAIARALYQRPEVLIFDEGTSALDNIVEAALLSSLERLKGTRTILHVAHRLSTVQRADRVIFVEDGRITGVGSYSDLETSHEGFRQMNAAQSSTRHRST